MDFRIIQKYNHHYKNQQNQYICYDIMADGILCGECYLYIGLEYLYQFGNIGYHIYEDYRGNHYAVKACRLLIEEAKKRGLSTVFFLVEPDNTASDKVLQKLGAILTRQIQVNLHAPAEECTTKSANPASTSELDPVHYKNLYEISLYP